MSTREAQGHSGPSGERLGGKCPQAVIRSIRQGQGVGDSKMLRIEQKAVAAPGVVTGLPSLLGEANHPAVRLVRAG